MTTVNAYAAASAGTPLAPTTIERRALGPHDVLIEITYCGICHGDRAEVGCIVGSCRECEYCKRGEEQFCVKGYTWTSTTRPAIRPRSRSSRAPSTSSSTR